IDEDGGPREAPHTPQRSGAPRQSRGAPLYPGSLIFRFSVRLSGPGDQQRARPEIQEVSVLPRLRVVGGGGLKSGLPPVRIGALRITDGGATLGPAGAATPVNELASVIPLLSAFSFT